MPEAESGGGTAAGEAQYKPLPEGLDTRNYEGEGLMLDVIVTAIKPGPTTHDPAKLSYAVVTQASEREHQVIRSASPLARPQLLKLKDKLVQVEVTPRFKPQKLGEMDPSGAPRLLHEGWYEILVRDGSGRAMGKFGVAALGWVTPAKGAEQPKAFEIQARGAWSAMDQFFDFYAASGGEVLLRMESVEYGQQQFTVEASDHSLHDVTLPHVAFRFLAPGQFETTEEHHREDSHPRDPEADHQPPK
jgi:hypothetical protein